ncbi:hypothetical protein OJ252_1047 [Cryptosporidium canis]|uniref:Uncharacterized protein n=1 Tax=Cryptosporidium canis TaxID=195482 RepID=A0ABQ8P9X7_9CRYT|nr:hypothetical protein OJ252_1047 [Cryptosporidium canis]
MNLLFCIANITFIFFLKCFSLDAAEAPATFKDDSLGDEVTNYETRPRSSEIASSLQFYDSKEINCLTEKALKLISLYLINLFRLLAMVTEESMNKELINIKSVIHEIEVQAHYYSRCLLISLERLEYIKLLIDSLSIHLLVDQLECEENKELLQKILLTLNNYWQIRSNIDELFEIIWVNSIENLEENLRMSVFSLLEQKQIIYDLFKTKEKSIKGLDGKKLKRIFYVKKSLIEGFKFSVSKLFDEFDRRNDLVKYNYENKKIKEKYLKLIKEGREEKMDKHDASFAKRCVRYCENEGFDNTLIFWCEVLIYQSIKVLGYVFDNISIFDSSCSQEREEILECESKVVSVIQTRCTELEISEDLSLKVREEVNSLLNFDEIKELDIKVVCKKRALHKDDILTLFKKQYRYLLTILSILRTRSAEFNSFYLQKLFKLALETYEPILKSLLKTFTKYEGADPNKLKLITEKQIWSVSEKDASILKQSLEKMFISKRENTESPKEAQKSCEKFKSDEIVEERVDASKSERRKSRRKIKKKLEELEKNQLAEYANSNEKPTVPEESDGDDPERYKYSSLGKSKEDCKHRTTGGRGGRSRDKSRSRSKSKSMSRGRSRSRSKSKSRSMHGGLIRFKNEAQGATSNKQSEMGSNNNILELDNSSATRPKTRLEKRFKKLHELEKRSQISEEVRRTIKEQRQKYSTLGRKSGIGDNESKRESRHPEEQERPGEQGGHEGNGEQGEEENGQEVLEQAAGFSHYENEDLGNGIKEIQNEFAFCEEVNTTLNLQIERILNIAKKNMEESGNNVDSAPISESCSRIKRRSRSPGLRLKCGKQSGRPSRSSSCKRIHSKISVSTVPRSRSLSQTRNKYDCKSRKMSKELDFTDKESTRSYRSGRGDCAGSSKLMTLFSTPESNEFGDPRVVNIQQFFGIKSPEMFNISDKSSIEEIQVALEECEKEIIHIYTDVAPLLSGAHFHSVKLIERKLVGKYISMLILLKGKMSKE